MKLWVRRYRDLVGPADRDVCRLHAVLCDLVPGGFARRITAATRLQLSDRHRLHRDRCRAAQLELARELVADLQRIDSQRRR